MIEPRKQSRYSKFNSIGAIHFISFRCFRNQKFLNNNRTCRYMANSILRARRIHHFDLWAYVIMPEHVHLLIYPTVEIYSISEILKSLKQPVARKSIDFLKQFNSGILKFMETRLEQPRYRFWQDGGGYDHLVDNYEDLRGIIEYIHNNPVKRGLVETPEEWYWSSAGEWLADRLEPISIDKDSFPFN